MESRFSASAPPLRRVREDEADAVRCALAQLSEDDRAALELRYMAGLEAREIATIYGVSDRAIRQRLERARDCLRRRLGRPVTGAMLLVAPVGGLSGGLAEAEPPSTLLPGLLKMSQLGSTVASATGASITTSTALEVGGLVMSAKELTVSVVLALALCGGLVVYFLDGESRDLDAGLPPSELSRQETASPRVERRGGSPGAAPEVPSRKSPATAIERSGGPVPDALVQAIAAREPEVHRYFDSRVGASPFLESTRFESLSDDDGRFHISGLEPGRWDLEVTSPNEAPLSRSFALDRQDLDLGDLVVAAPATISGVVQTETGLPGRYSLAHLAPGAVRVSVAAAGYAVATVTVELTSEGEPDVDIVLERGRSLEGRVTDHTGNPVADPYELRLTAPGHVFQLKELRLAAGEEKDLEFLLETGGTIEVTVVDAESGKPIPEAGVAVSRQGVRDVFAGSRTGLFTDERGRCRVAALADGEYYVVAGHPYYLRDAAARTQAVSVRGERVEATVKLRPAGRLVGRITGLKRERKGPVSTHYTLEIRATGESQGDERRMFHRSRVYIRPDGTFSNDSMVPGEYRVVLSKQKQKTGKMVNVSPTSGFTTSTPVGEKTELEIDTIKIEAGRTTESYFAVPADF